MRKLFFLGNRLVQNGAIRQFEIVGEATKNISTPFRTGRVGKLYLPTVFTVPRGQDETLPTLPG